MLIVQRIALAAMVATAGLFWTAQAAEQSGSSAAGQDQAQPSKESPAEAAPDGDVPDRELRIDLTFYTWMSSVSSTVASDDSESTVDMAFKDILKVVDFANFGHLEIQKGKWGLFSEMDFIKLSGDTEFRRPRSGIPFEVQADGVIKQAMVELGVIRSFDGSRVGLDLLAGARYFRLESDVSVGPIDSSLTKDWVDPMIGARVRWRISDRWLASLRADVAGFGLGSGSELSTNIIAAINYDINEKYSIGFGYRYLDIDYEGDSADISMTTYGPVIGMTVHF